MKTIFNIVGARPNFMKIAPIQRCMLQSNRLKPILIHTGQHYDKAMSKVFFDDLEMPQPDHYLGVGSGSHAQQTASIMIALEKAMLEYKPDAILVVGDVNSTIAAAIVAAKLLIPIIHIEAGLRSFDRTMPEEINRILTDSLADYLFITEDTAQNNLLNEGVHPSKIFFVGNVMIDSLYYFRKKAQQSNILENLKLNGNFYTVLTLHRPSNVDMENIFTGIIDALDEIQQQIPIIFPIHPRTKKMIEAFKMGKRITEMKNFQLIEPLGYLDFLNLMINARFMLTDSGGIQEETTALSIPCLTLRENTERPVTVELGTNIIVGMNATRIKEESFKIINGNSKHGTIPPLWDGKAAERIVEVLENKL
jgi:UDP-N-acetylglucosamine 2-epimerase (non-hydrolysing)